MRRPPSLAPSRRRSPRFGGAGAAYVREFINFDVAVTRAALRHLGPEIQALLCLPALGVLALIDHFFPGA